MKDYSFVDETVIGAVRSLKCYGDYQRFCQRFYYAMKPFVFEKKDLVRYVRDLSDYRRFRAILAKFGVDEFINACKYVHNIYMRTTRIRQRLVKMIELYDELFFVTLTLNDDSINLPFEELLKFTKKLFFTSSSAYFFNADFGQESHRLHFHGVATFDLLPLSKVSWNYGFFSIQRIRHFRPGDSKISPADSGTRRVPSEDIARLSRYLTKIARHSTKDSSTCKTYFSRLKSRS